MEEDVMTWLDYCKHNNINPKNKFQKDDIIHYFVTSFGIKAEYISHVNYQNETIIQEINSVCISSDDEDLIGMIDYDVYVDFCYELTDLRLATEKEIEIYNKYFN